MKKKEERKSNRQERERGKVYGEKQKVEWKDNFMRKKKEDEEGKIIVWKLFLSPSLKVEEQVEK